MYLIDVEVQTPVASAGRWRLYGIGDPHLDKATHDRRALTRYIRHIASDPHGLPICVGDVFDVTLPGHKFFDASTQRRDVVAMMDRYLNKLIEEAVDVFAPILEAGRPLIIAEGNHDVRLHGVNAVQMLCTMLNARAKECGWSGVAHYAGGEALIRVRALDAPTGKGKGIAGGTIYTVYLAHGTGGGMQPGGKVNRATWQTHIADADVYLRGHVEEADIRIVDRYRLPSKGALRLMTRPVAYYTAAGYGTRRRAGVVDYAGRKSLPPVDRRIQWLEIQTPRGGTDSRGHGGRMWAREPQW